MKKKINEKETTKIIKPNKDRRRQVVSFSIPRSLLNDWRNLHNTAVRSRIAEEFIRKDLILNKAKKKGEVAA